MVIFCYLFTVFSILIAILSVATLILLTLSPKYYWCSIMCMYIFFNKYYKAYKEILALPGDLRLIHLDDVSFTNIKDGEIIYIYDDDNKINIIVYEFIINGNIWDAAIRLYKKIYNIK